MDVNDQRITENYAIYNGDCMRVMPNLKSGSVDLSIYSPPFAGLYNYSSSVKDFSNCKDKKEFLAQYEYLIEQIYRVTKAGRMTAVHCQHVPGPGNKLWHFPKFILEMHEKHGFDFFDERYIWKEPLKTAIRTRAQGLMHKWIVKDSTKCRSALADIVMIFRKKGENKVPVTHDVGLTYYAGNNPMPRYMEETYGKWDDLVRKYANWKDPKTNKMSHVIWQRYASVFWDDIRQSNKNGESNVAVLEYKKARDKDDEKHIHPLHLDVIDRIINLYSNPGEVVLTPFMGVGSEVYGAIKTNRKAIGIELKVSYFKQAVKNIESALETNSQDRLF